jgi:uncharacterized SAM-binding protein YcdF (DUF218 family)
MNFRHPGILDSAPAITATSSHDDAATMTKPEIESGHSVGPRASAFRWSRRGAIQGRLLPFYAAAFAGAFLIVVGIIVGARYDRILGEIGQSWVVSDTPRHADAIILLGGGLDVRAAAAATLFRDGFSAQILVSDADGASNRKDLIGRGVPAAAIAIFGKAPANTYAEADAVREWARTTALRRIIVPTELFPSRRVQWTFDHQLRPLGVSTIVIAYAPDNYTLKTWWRTRSGIMEFAQEVAKYAYYRVRYGGIQFIAAVLR